MFVLILIGLSHFRTSALKAGDTISDKDCLTFTAIDGDATVKFSWSEAKASRGLFSTDEGNNWLDYDANQEINLKQGENIKFKGSYICMDRFYEGFKILGGFKTSGGNLSVSGNLNSLRLDNNLEKFIGLENCCFQYMFEDCKSMVDASQLILDAEILAPNCYYNMFLNCINLNKVPNLPETSLALYCYSGMFKGCTNLEFSKSMTDNYNKKWTIHTDNGDSGYKSMFDGCIVNWLKYAPENSIVTLYQKEKDNIMVSNRLTGSYNNDNKSELLSAISEGQETSSPQESSDDMSSSQIDAQSVSSSQLANTQGYESDAEEQENSSLKEPSDDIDPKYDSDTKSVSSNQLANSQDYESKSSKSLAASKNSDSMSSNSLTSNQNSSGSSNATKSSAIKTGELTLNSTLLEFFLLMLLSFKRKRFGC